MKSMRPDPGIHVQAIRILLQNRTMPMLILTPKEGAQDAPGVLWIHGGGYILGMKEMVHMSQAVGLVVTCGAVVFCPEYRLAWQRPYPAAIEDCYAALLWLRDHAAEYHVRPDQIMVGGESAGGGLCAALCMMARDYGEVPIAYQMPLYPMLDNLDTESSRDNHGKVWNTRRNHLGWRLYLRQDARREDISPYAAPARQTDYTGLPPCYTFVGDGEPFYSETLTYIRNLQAAGIPARADVYSTDIHAFDMMGPELPISEQATRRFLEEFQYARAHYYTGV